MFIYENQYSNKIAKLWIDPNTIEKEALEQIDHCLQLPFLFRHLAIMPDVHKGYGVTIGSVLCTENVIIPYAVGADISCGMIAIKTPWTTEEITTDTIKNIMSEVRKVIPVGFNKHTIKQNEDLMPGNGEKPDKEEYPIAHKEYQNALVSLGTLGSGNHFWEVQKDKDNNIWIMIHSGSRNLGYTIADYYNKLAVDLNKQWHSGIPSAWQLAFLPLDTDYGQLYLNEMNYCIEFALANRLLMMKRTIDIFNKELKWKIIDESKIININHNYALLENHFGKNIMVHRKGATLARENTIGIIPGSQGTKSYIVKGKGNRDSYNSCSHGAGRIMGRKQAEKTLNLEEEIKKLDAQNIIHSIRTIKDLDEAAGAYKNIEEVMKNQENLIEIIEELTPLAVIKG